MQKIAILGFAREGKSTLAFLRRSPDYRGAELRVLDQKKVSGLPRGVRGVFGKNYLQGLSDFDIVFRTPGLPYLSPAIQKAKRAGVKISSATKLFFEETRKLANPPLVVGITGTKGKGTTATLLYNIFSAARKNVFLAGNIGTSPLELLPKLSEKKGGPPAIVILELSSFQLQDMEMSPSIALVLDVFPDHQDAHKTLEEYYGAKANIANFQSARDAVFFFEDDRVSQGIARHGHGKKIPVDERAFRLFKETDLTMPGHHNFRNAVMAATVARTLHIPDATIAKVVKGFAGNEHRLELVRTLHGIAFYNDSASTNPQTSAAAVRSFPMNAAVLMLGGQDKNLDYAPLGEAICDSRVKTVVLLGENKTKILRTIRQAIAHVGAKIVEASTLSAAVAAAYRAALLVMEKQGGSPVVIFSPGATSFDMFENYADRGEKFKAIVKKLK